jgi:hypothetical protein
VQVSARQLALADFPAARFRDYSLDSVTCSSFRPGKKDFSSRQVLPGRAGFHKEEAIAMPQSCAIGLVFTYMLREAGEEGGQVTVPLVPVVPPGAVSLNHS